MIHRIVRQTRSTQVLVPAQIAAGAGGEGVPTPEEPQGKRSPVRRILFLIVELLVGLLVVSAFVLGVFYYRLEKGAIDLKFIVPSIEKAINEQLIDLSVKIDSAFVGKNTHSAGVHFRLRNIVLYNKEHEAIANSPLAAVDLNGKALLWGIIAPSQVVFIKPTLDVAYSENNGLSLSYVRNDMIADLLNQKSGNQKNNTGGAKQSDIVKNIDFMKAVGAAFQEARSHRNTSSYLTQFGVRDATIKYSQGDKTQHIWKVPDFVIDLHHSDTGSVIRGFGKLGMDQKEEKIVPWKLRFQTQQSDITQDLQLDVGFADITPRSLHRLLPNLANIKNFNIPLSGKVNAKLNRLGELRTAFVNIRLAAGAITLPWQDKKGRPQGFSLDEGELKLAYSRKGNKIHIIPSLFRWGKNQTVLSGVIQAHNSTSSWKFAIQGSDTRLAADDFNLEPMIIDKWWITGRFFPNENRLEISNSYLRAGNAEIRLSGKITELQGSPGIYMQGKVSSISVPALKRLWPSLVATGARDWVGNNVQDGQIISGKLALAIPPGTLEKLQHKGDLSPEMVQFDLDLSDLIVKYDDDLIPLKIPHAKFKIAGRQLSVNIPKARMYFDRGSPLKLSHGIFSISDLRQKDPGSDLSFRVAGKLRKFHSFLNQPGFKFLDGKLEAGSEVKGNLKGTVNMHIPLVDELTFKHVSLNADLRLTNIKSKKLFGEMAVDAGTVNLKLTEKAIGARGGIVIKGIPTKLNWQYIFGSGKNRQPPVRLSAVLSKSSRHKLGLAALDQIVQGDVPVIIAISGGQKGRKTVQVRADLTNSMISNTALGWSKPPGIASTLQFDVDQNKSKGLELKNFSLVGNKLTVEGHLELYRKNNGLKSFTFSNISSDLINGMSLSGKKNRYGIFELVANIDHVDGQGLLRRQLFIKKKKNSPKRQKKSGFDYNLIAKIGRISGGRGAFLRETKIDLKKRSGKIVGFNLHGKSNNSQSSVAMRIEQAANGKRTLKAESADAGATFRMVGLYPNVRGGRLSLLVNMDPKGKSERYGTLWVKNFHVITSQKVDDKMKSSEVFNNEFLGSAPSSVRVRKGKRRVLRTTMQFDQLKAPFSYADGQFILHDSYVNGPVIGATLRGKIDFRTERMRLGGTYVPLYGVNSALSDIPILSQLLVGRQGEGVFGVTFAIEGSTSKPTVIVNPVSLLTPGVFRQIFDFNNTVKNRQFQKLPQKRKRSRRRRRSNASETY